MPSSQIGTQSTNAGNTTKQEQVIKEINHQVEQTDTDGEDEW